LGEWEVNCHNPTIVEGNFRDVRGSSTPAAATF